MAIVFKEKLKTQQLLVYLLFFLIAAGTFIIGWRFTTKKIPLQETLIPQFVKKVKINLEILKNPLLQTLQPIEKITPLETEPGRENPFLPYEIPAPSKTETQRKSPSQ